MELTPDTIKAIGEAAIGVIAAIGAVMATLASAITAIYTYKNRRDLHIAYDRIRQINGEPQQFRYDSSKRIATLEKVPEELIESKGEAPKP